MSKHQGPWKLDHAGGYIVDANGADVARVDTPDPETRAVLLRAGEMWEAVQGISKGNVLPILRVAEKIRLEIAAGKGTT